MLLVISVRGGGSGGVGRPPGLEKFQGALCFQGKQKLLKNPECKKYIQYSAKCQGTRCFSTQLRRECWVATGLSQWNRCSDPQGSGCGRESINPAKMKLCPGCHNPFASGKLYKCLQRL